MIAAVVLTTGYQVTTADQNQDQIVILVIKEAAIVLPEAILLHLVVIPVQEALPEDHDHQVVLHLVADLHHLVARAEVVLLHEAEATREDSLLLS